MTEILAMRRSNACRRFRTARALTEETLKANRSWSTPAARAHRFVTYRDYGDLALSICDIRMPVDTFASRAPL